MVWKVVGLVVFEGSLLAAWLAQSPLYYEVRLPQGVALTHMPARPRKAAQLTHTSTLER